ncbi:HugZ family pyridoxamine 5'-phosphate oxidase [Marinivivus vitaminiproducens]|uniref:HugZ family pyridoxamine 5'-phosphate oxidase n=1 Tax=Marinivivus vitaminiproducens TaxID=3035935 RepID=UPI00279C74FD|nr:pyridoxamine 5'-phosphate oxidase family protein [Geminicoccaceae bacterium SCSIO 64248]
MASEADTSATPAPITPRGLPVREGLGLPLDAPKLARTILRGLRGAVLSTTDPGSGYPYGSVTNVATDHDGTPIFILAWLALHTRNIHVDNRVAMTLANLGRGDALGQPRLILVGRALQAADHQVNRFRRRYLARHPKAEIYTTLPDARFYRLRIEALQVLGGPGRNASELTPADVTTDLSGAEPLLDAETEEIARINSDPAGVQRLAVRAGGRADRWTATGYDPEGLDLVNGDDTARLWFPQRILSVAALRDELGGQDTPRG